MNRVFYIFRHGETDWNRERRCQGHTNTELNETGLLQALELAQKMQDYPIDVIVSSDLQRALRTGTLVAEKQGVPLIVEPRLREMSYGEAEGMLYEKAVDHYGAELWQKFQCFKKENDDAAFPGGESRLVARERFQAALLDLIVGTSYQSFGISTHGGALRNILHSFLPVDQALLPIPNCVVYKCEYHFLQKKFVVDPKPL
jgi:probable phosphoglycerate mutase